MFLFNLPFLRDLYYNTQIEIGRDYQKNGSGFFPCSQANPSNFVHADSTVTVHVAYLQGWKVSFFHTLSMEKEQLILSLLHLTDEAYSSPETETGLLTLYDDSCLLKKQGIKYLRNACVLPGSQWEKDLLFGIRCTESTVGTA